MRRMNFGCGPIRPDGWDNVDKSIEHPVGYQWRADVREGLPFDDCEFDYVVANHSLQELTQHELPDALRELHRLLKPGGVLRVLLPDVLEVGAAIGDGQTSDAEFDWLRDLIPDDVAEDIDAKWAVWATWYGSNVSIIPPPLLIELAMRTGFSLILRCEPHHTCSKFEGICDLDDREPESYVMELTK